MGISSITHLLTPEMKYDLTPAAWNEGPQGDVDGHFQRTYPQVNDPVFIERFLNHLISFHQNASDECRLDSVFRQRFSINKTFPKLDHFIVIDAWNWALMENNELAKKAEFISRVRSVPGGETPVSDEVLQKTADYFVKEYPTKSAEELFNMAAESAWRLDGQVLDRGDRWGEYLLAGNSALHEHFRSREEIPSTLVYSILGHTPPSLRGGRPHAILTALYGAAQLLHHMHSPIRVNPPGISALYASLKITPINTPEHQRKKLIDALREIAMKGPKRKQAIQAALFSGSIDKLEQVLHDDATVTIYEELRDHFPAVDRWEELSLREQAQLVINTRPTPEQITGITNLVLNNKNLYVLPEQIGDLTNLTSLLLHNNHLSALPDSFANLTQLRELYLYNNHLSALPDSFGNLTQLSGLYLFNNQLSTLPDSFGNLTQLRELSLFNNQLSTLPDSFRNLTQLSRLYLDNNQLSTLPDSFGNLTQLRELSLCNNQLSILPDSFGNLTQLRELSLFNNQLSTLPDSFRNLTQLRLLDLEGNSFHR